MSGSRQKSKALNRRKTVHRRQGRARPKAHELCLGCAELLPKRATRDVRCPHCGYSVPRERYAALVAEGRALVRYAVQYRRFYEDAVVDGEIRAYPCLPPSPEALTWIALAAISGVVGGAAYDLAKGAALKIIKRVQTKRSDELRALSIITFEECEEAARELRQGLPSVSPAVREAIRQEIIADEATAAKMFYVVKEAKNPRRLTADDFRRVRTTPDDLRRARERAEALLNGDWPSGNYDDLWLHVDEL